MLTVILGSALLFNTVSTCDLNLSEKGDIWAQNEMKYFGGNCPNTRPYCETHESEK